METYTIAGPASTLRRDPGLPPCRKNARHREAAPNPAIRGPCGDETDAAKETCRTLVFLLIGTHEIGTADGTD
jgi:hypothetical protein